jgi:MFS transporter, YNFM family, putative membrane transport protein
MGIIACVSVVCFSLIYGPQPILPALQAEFSLSESTAGLVVASVLIPLGVAPLFYGFLLEVLAAKRLMLAAVAGLAVCELGMAWAETYPVFLGLRLCQGLVIPAALTAMMTHLSATHQGAQLQRALATYISSTILGGFLGRLLTGLFSTAFGWRSSFVIFGLALLGCLVLLAALEPAPTAAVERLRPADALDQLRRPGFLRVYVMVGLAFFVYAALPNFLPFRLRELDASISEVRIGLTYSGYLLGLFISLFAPSLVARLGGEGRALTRGLTGFLAGTLLFLIPEPTAIVGVMFLLCSSMALIQAVSPGYVNRRAGPRKGVTNGLYISFYYTGGALGAYLPGLVYKSLGWTALVISLALVVCLALVLARGLIKEDGDRPGA